MYSNFVKLWAENSWKDLNNEILLELTSFERGWLYVGMEYYPMEKFKPWSIEMGASA